MSHIASQQRSAVISIPDICGGGGDRKGDGDDGGGGGGTGECDVVDDDRREMN